MRRMTGDEIRAEFLRFFEGKGHTVLPSAPLVPHDDPTLLWINCGMAPLKAYFEERVEAPNRRLASCQKSIRTNDIENVGRTPRHHTFFEMLGNFSIGDYFKREAILWAWEFSVDVMGLPPDRIWVTIHPTDTEAADVWLNEVGLAAGRLVRLEDNFWDIGPGPCGPNSELYIDRGLHTGCGHPDCKPGCDCPRFLEYWNLVFTQFSHNADGTRTPLPKQNIDTGMGLERMASIMQGVDSNYETDLLHPLVEHAARLARVAYRSDSSQDTALHVIADHIRTVVFSIADGALPSNEGRGYVIRRLLRRAARFGKALGLGEPFLHRLVDTVAKIMGGAYPEVAAQAGHIARVVLAEEERFLTTLNEGLQLLGEALARLERSGGAVVPGRDAFVLYDTFGFPLDLTEDVAAEHGFTVDREGFAVEMAAQRERARAARKDVDGWDAGAALAGLGDVPPTRFTGYGTLSGRATVLAVLAGAVRQGSAGAGPAVVVLDETPFYAESGGQVADTGAIRGPQGTFKVDGVQKLMDGKYLHVGRVTQGVIAAGDSVEAQVDAERRRDIARNHTATHLLHRALRDVLGEHVQQAGSLVAPERLRFDFTHPRAVSPDELRAIEDRVNAGVLAGLPVEAVETSLEEARARGALALFGEKYGERVRVVTIGDGSMELCGGTHLRNTAEAGLFKLRGEASVGSGLRRVEAVTGAGVLEHVRETEATLAAAAQNLRASAAEVPGRVAELLEELKAKDKELEALARKLSRSGLEELLATAAVVDGARLVAGRVEAKDMDALRAAADSARDRLGSGVVVLGAVTGDKANLVAMVTSDLVEQGFHAGHIIREVAKAAGGSGGGRPEMAQAGAKDAASLDRALAQAGEIVAAVRKR